MSVKFISTVDFKSLGVRVGKPLYLKCDSNDKPLDPFWSRRLADGCIEPHKKKSEKPKVVKPEKNEGEKS